MATFIRAGSKLVNLDLVAEVDIRGEDAPESVRVLVTTTTNTFVLMGDEAREFLRHIVYQGERFEEEVA